MIMMLDKPATPLIEQYKQERDEFENEVIRLREDRKRLVEALRYWMPKQLPLPDQHDSPSEYHKLNWHKHQRLLAELEPK